MNSKSNCQKKDKNNYVIFIFFVSIICLLIICVLDLKFHNICHDSINDLLTTLIQIEVVILTILVSLSIVLIQLTVTSYSARVAKIYQQDPVLLFITIIYILIIIGSLTYLKSSNIFNQNTIMISLLYVLGIIYIAVIPAYIYRLYEILKPENIINKISKKIALSKIMSQDSDYIFLMIDFLRGSFLKHDFESIQKGLKKMVEKLKIVINNTTDENISYATKIIFNGFKSYCTFLLIQQDSEIISITLKKYEEIANLILNKNKIQNTSGINHFDEAGEKIMSNFKSIADIALKKKNEEAIDKLNFSLEELGKISIQRNLCNTLKENMLTYREIWEKTKKLKLDDLSDSVIGYISYLAEHSIKKQNSNSIKIINSQLIKIAIHSIKNDYEKDLNKIISIYENLLHKAIEEDITWTIH